MKRLLPCIFTIILFTIQVRSSHMMGGEVTYRHLGGLRYEITFKLYRDCRGIPLNSPTVEMKGSGVSGAKTLSITLVSIRDVSNYCKKDSSPCSPQNQTISSSNPAVEEHTYRDTVDFNTTDTVFRKSCRIFLGIGQCCRNIGSSTSGTDFWVWSELDICAAKNNSSPLISSRPENILCCNQPYYYALGAIDTLDYDSLSYEFTDPMTSWTAKMTWGGSTTAKSPFTVYWPAGYDKSKGPFPSANPPIGTYLDPETGDLIFTPTDCSEVTAASIKVKEWRKDSTGTYVNIGEVKRDIVYIVKTCPGNHMPTLNGPYRYSICANQKICFTVTSDDKQYKPPPPAKASPPDTVSIAWNRGIGRGATFTITDTSARLQSGKFCWTPKDSDVSDLPYTFTVTARDNVCSMNGISIKSYSVKVNQIAKAERSYTHIKNGLYEFRSQKDSMFKGTATCIWEVLDSNMAIVDSSYVDVYQNGSYKGFFRRAIDSVQFRKPGNYIIHHRINNAPLNCPTDYFDTLKVGAITPFLDIEPKLLQEKSVCRGYIDTLYPLIKNAKSPVKFSWSSSPADTFQTLIIKVTKNTSFKVYVFDSAGYRRSATWNFYVLNEPKVKAGKDVLVCEKDSVSLVATASDYTDTVHWSWWFKGKEISDLPAIKVMETGMYIVRVNDINKCNSSYDTVVVDNLIVNAKVDAGLDKAICDGEVLDFKAIHVGGLKSNTYQWFQLGDSNSTTLISSVDSIRVKPVKDQVYFVKQITTVDSGSLKCMAQDTDSVKVIFHPLPEVRLTNTKLCQNELELDLNTLILKPTDTGKGNSIWSLIRSLPKPNGNQNTLTELVYDKDPGAGTHYYLRVDESNIKVPGNFRDSIVLGLMYRDEFGCENTTQVQTSILVRANVTITLGQRVVSRCIGDSIILLSDYFAVNYYGGKWFTVNDSSGFLKWPQGGIVQLPEKLETHSLNPTGGKYMLMYTLMNNNCFSSQHATLTIIPFPKIEWSQINETDSILLRDNTKNSTGREWYVGGNLLSRSVTVKLSNFIAMTKPIRLSVFNLMCKTDSFITPSFNPVGIKPFEKTAFNIYPNPVSNTLVIENLHKRTCQLSIMNSLGQQILELDMWGRSEKIDVSAWSKGLYSVLIKSGSVVMRMSFLKD